MRGSRGKLGFFMPSTNTIVEPDMYAMASRLDGVTVHFSRLPISEREALHDKRIVWLEKLNAGMESSCKELAAAKVDVIAYTGTATTCLKGVGWDREVIKIMEKASGGIPATTASTGIVESLKVFDAKKVSVVSPLSMWDNDIFRDFLKGNGIEVANLETVTCPTVFDIAAQPPDAIYKLAKKGNTSNADAIVIQCTNYAGVEVVDKIEQDLGKPTVTANQATFWSALRKARVNQQIEGYGKLLREF